MFNSDGLPNVVQHAGNAPSFQQCYGMVTSQFPDSNGMTMENPIFHPGQKTYGCFGFVEHAMDGLTSVNPKWLSCFFDTNAGE